MATRFIERREEPLLTMDGLPPAARNCQCGKKISGADTHSECQACLRLQHAQAATTHPVACEHCARFWGKTCRSRLARLATLGVADPMMVHPTTTGTGLRAPPGGESEMALPLKPVPTGKSPPARRPRSTQRAFSDRPSPLCRGSVRRRRRRRVRR